MKFKHTMPYALSTKTPMGVMMSGRFLLIASPILLALFSTSSRSAKTAPLPGHDPEEAKLALQLAGYDLRCVDAMYAEAKFTFAEQRNQITALQTRATWLVGTAAAEVVALVSQTRNIGDLRPSGLLIGAFLGCGVIAVSAAIIALGAVLPSDYRLALAMKEMDQYLDWDPSRAKLQWLETWKEMFEFNSRKLQRRFNLLRLSFFFVITSTVILVGCTVALLWGTVNV